MPFPPQPPHPFTWEKVEALQPNQLGCFGVLRRNQWIFVGAGDIRAELINLLAGRQPCVLAARPTHWMHVLTADMQHEAARLIRELEPTCNQQSIGVASRRASFPED